MKSSLTLVSFFAQSITIWTLTRSSSIHFTSLNNGHEFIKTHKEEEHGYGVKTIEQVAEKYGGFISYAQTKNQLVATVLLPLRIIAQDK
ncbi:MAG: GHKL domain-containing protein [Erysipelotrichaceae bacterium]|nr:GHKL domain-containing protein [Erysipelotrichaceae bacterium]